MNTPPVFKFHSGSGSITDDGHTIMSGIVGSRAMQAETDRLQALHAHGRVAMSTCSSGPCDWHRIHVPKAVTEATRERLVLCPSHTRALALALAPA